MAIKKIKVSQLPIAQTTSGLSVLGVDEKNQSVQAQMELLRGNKGDSAFQLWKNEPGNESKSYEDYLAYNRQPATEAATGLTEYQTQVTSELNQLAETTEQAKTAAQQASQRANEIASNPTKVGTDNFVYVYNEATKAYDKTAILVKGDSAYQLWLNEPGNSGKTYEEYLAYNRQPATEVANSLNEYQVQVTSELTQLAQETDIVRSATQGAIDRANEIASNPTKVGDDHYVYAYNEATKSYDKTDIYVKGDKGDKGNLLYASFEIDLETGQLVQTTPDEYNGPTFELNNDGELIAIING